MPDLLKIPPHAILRHCCVLSCLSALMLGASQAAALSPNQLDRLPSVQVVQATQAGEKARPAPQPQGDAQAASTGLADLNEVLAATQKKLDELFKASAALAERREAFKTLEQENERLGAALRDANTARAELESASKLAQARIAELTKTAEVAARDSGRVDKELADLRRQNADLAERLAVADNARSTMERQLEQTRSEMQQKLAAATGAAEQSRGALAQLREQLERAGQDLARAQSAREQAVARASELERSKGDVERVRAELSAVKEQLTQAASTALEAERGRQTTSAEAERLRSELERARQELAATKSEAERGRQTASAEAERLRGELGRARQELAATKSEAERGRQTTSVEAERLRGELGGVRQELAAAKSEAQRFSTANAALTEQVNSLRADSQSAMEAARRNLVVMEERIEQLNTALVGAGLGATGLVSEPQASPIAKPDEAAIANRTPSAPSEAVETGGAASGDNEVAAVRPATASSPKESSELAKFNENLAYLNRRAMDAAGADLFSGIEAAGEGVVNVSTTPAWANIPAAGQRSYLNSLLDLWIVAQEGSGPAVVRIVDPDGRVLLEKSGAVQKLPRATE
jgi:chromosome segregation ATPase